MVIRLELFGTLRNRRKEYDPAKGVLLDFEHEITLTELLREIDIPERSCLVVINGAYVKVRETIIIKENDVVQIFMLVGGG